MSNVFRTIVAARIAGAIQEAKAAAALDHAGVKGAIREVIIASLLRPLLPSDVGVSSGIVVSSFHGAQSTQQDIVVYNRRLLPPVLFDHGPAIIPIESALFCIEVKSVLCASALEAADRNARKLRELDLAVAATSEAAKLQVSGPLCLLFALDSDLSPDGKGEGDRLRKLFDPNDMMLRGVCVLGRGYWAPNRRLLWDHHRSALTVDPDHASRPPWVEVPADRVHSEVLMPLSLMFDLIAKLSLSRGVPLLSAYLSGE